MIHSNFNDIIYGMSNIKEINVSVIPIDENFVGRSKFFHRPKFMVSPSYPTFILPAKKFYDDLSSFFYFRTGLNYLNYWSTESSFFFIGNECSDASQKLKNVYLLGAFNSYYICPNEFSNNTNIYTLNPYADRTPKPWQKVEGANESYPVSTLYKMSFINGKAIIDFRFLFFFYFPLPAVRIIDS